MYYDYNYVRCIQILIDETRVAFWLNRLERMEYYASNVAVGLLNVRLRDAISDSMLTNELAYAQDIVRKINRELFRRAPKRPPVYASYEVNLEDARARLYLLLTEIERSVGNIQPSAKSTSSNKQL